MSAIFPATSQNIERAAELIKKGQPVVFPTETVYGLGADALSDSAVASIYALKSRPQFNPLIIHMHDLEMVKYYVRWNEYAEKLAAKFWPGPLTLVLPRKEMKSGISLLATAGLSTVAVRMPAHPVAQQLIALAGRPIAAPSANRSGRISPTLATHADQELGAKLAMILDGGPCAIGLESTVVDCTQAQPVILRPGSVTEEQIITALPLREGGIAAWQSGRVINPVPPTGSQMLADSPASGELLIKSPGQLASHYAPNLPMRLDVTAPNPDEAFITFGLASSGGARRSLNLSPAGNLKEAAANLFAVLRALDTPECSAIAVMPIPEEGIGAAINDRLRRAATR